MHRLRFRPRFTVRWLMVAVAIVGLLLGASRWIEEMTTRSADYDRRAGEFFYGSFRYLGKAGFRKDGTEVNLYDDENDLLKRGWRFKMAAKYWRLSAYPWMPVEPDLPRPGRLAHPRRAVDSTLPLPGGQIFDSILDSRPPAWTFPWTRRNQSWRIH